MGTLLAIDPGVSTGWASFFSGRLVKCGRGAPPPEPDWVVYDAVLIECPRAYPRGKADPNDLIALARKVGRLEQLFPGAEIVYPHTWKGSLTKDQCHVRWLLRLTDAETVVLNAGLRGVPASAHHDVRDAVCLGLWKLERKKT